MNLSVGLITHNEEKKLPWTLNAVKEEEFLTSMNK
jgi:glycosyltransferase involved in cell wall biosynthesis